MRNVSDKICRENQNTKFTFNNILFSENRAVYVTVEKYGRIGQATDGNITRRVRFEFWINESGIQIHTQNTYVVMLISYQRQQWLGKRAPLLRLQVLCLTFI